MGRARHARPVAADEAPQRVGVLGVRRRHQRQQHRERDRHVGLGRIAGMDMPDRIAEPLLDVLPLVAVEKLLVVVDLPRDHVEVEPLRRLRLAVHEQRQRLRRRIAQPFVDGEAVALRLGNLLALLVEEELVVEAFRRRAAERAADFARELDRVDQVLAGHLVVDAERDPAHRPVGLPLQLGAPAGDQRGHRLLGVGVLVRDRAGLGVVREHRHLQHDAGRRRDRQERRIGLRALLAQRRQHDVHHGVEALQHLEQRRVEAARHVAVGRRHELVLEAEMVEEGAQPRVVGGAERRIFVRERVRDCATAACRDATPASPCSARCPAPCAARPCRRRTRSAGS